MGIGKLWEKIEDLEPKIAKDTSLVEYAAEHFHRKGRPLWIAVDQASWWYKNPNPREVAAIRKQWQLPARPVHVNMTYRVLSLLRQGIQLVFVFEGERPTKRGQAKPQTADSDLQREVKIWGEMLEAFGVPCHVAPGEAEAECAEMQRRGVIDAVWSEDGDTFMFGSSVLIRSLYKVKGGGLQKSKERCWVYNASDIRASSLALDREGFVLYCVLAGGDYGPGLYNCGTELALQVIRERPDLAKELCALSPGDLSGALRWRSKLQGYLKGIPVPANFPDLQVVQNYNKPAVSDCFAKFDPREAQQFNSTVDEENLLRILGRLTGTFFDRDYFKWTIPTYLVKKLLSKRPREDLSSLDLKIEKKGDLGYYIVTYNADCLRSPGGKRIKPSLSARIESQIPIYILEHAVPYVITEFKSIAAMEKATTPKKKASKLAEEKTMTPLDPQKRGRPSEDASLSEAPAPKRLDGHYPMFDHFLDSEPAKGLSNRARNSRTSGPMPFSLNQPPKPVFYTWTDEEDSEDAAPSKRRKAQQPRIVAKHHPA